MLFVGFRNFVWFLFCRRRSVDVRLDFHWNFLGTKMVSVSQMHTVNVLPTNTKFNSWLFNRWLDVSWVEGINGSCRFHIKLNSFFLFAKTIETPTNQFERDFCKREQPAISRSTIFKIKPQSKYSFASETVITVPWFLKCFNTEKHMQNKIRTRLNVVPFKIDTWTTTIK